MKNTVVKKVIIGAVVIAIIAVLIAVIVSMSGNKKDYDIAQIAEKDYKYFQIYSDGKFGIADDKGNMVVPNSYADVIIPNPQKAVFLCTSDNNEQVWLNASNEQIFGDYGNVTVINLEGTSSSLPYEKAVLAYEKDGKFGLIDFDGNEVTKPIYEEVASVKYKEGEILAKKDGKYGVINNKGVELVPFEYDSIEGDKYYKDSYKDAGYIVGVNTNDGFRYGYINNKWKELVKPEYTSISRISDTDNKDIYLIAAKDGKYGIIKEKEELVEFEYQSIIYNQDTKLVSVQRNQNYGVLNLKGEEIVPIQYKSIRFNGIYIYAKTASGEKYFDSKGKETDKVYTGMKKVQDKNLYIVTNDKNLYGLADEGGKQLIENKYLYMDYAFGDYFIAYKEGEGLGVVDKNDKVCVEFKYSILNKIGDKELLNATQMSKDSEETTIISKDMKEITRMKNAQIAISDNYIEMYNDGSEIYINNTGELKQANEVIKPEFLSKYFKTYKDNGEIYYSTERI